MWLLAATAAWAVLGTVVPQGSLDAEAARAWGARWPTLAALASAAGLDSAFSAPVFLAALAYLGVATAVCAWERTREAARVWGRGGVTEPEAARALERPHLSVPSVRFEEVLDALRRTGLREAESASEGATALVAGRWGLLGSPVFHWALAALFIVVAAGRLTRSEGFVIVPVGEPVAHAREAYAQLDEAVFPPGFHDVELELVRIDRGYVAGGVPRGDVPVVAARDDRGGRPAQPVHANNPLRHGPLTVHDKALGVFAEMTFIAPSGQSASQRVFFDRTEATRTPTAELALTGDSGEDELVLAVTGLLSERAPTVLVEVSDASTGETLDRATLAEGDRAGVGEAGEVRFSDAGSHAVLSVVQDWSVPWLYALLTAGTLALAVAVLNPYRRVVVAQGQGPDGPFVGVCTRHARGDAIFREAVRAAVEGRTGATTKEEPK